MPPRRPVASAAGFFFSSRARVRGRRRRCSWTAIPLEALSARYWSHGVFNYNEQRPDGFYDVCGVLLHPGFQAKFEMIP